MGMEYEWKFSADTEAHQTIRAAYPDQWQQISMETTYYDTPDCDLSRKKCTLRCRLENGKHVCTLKTPGAGSGRGEWELACEDIQSAFPELRALSGDPDLSRLDRTSLVPVCGARFVRHCRTLDLDGTVVELALDEGILFSGHRQLPLCEVEVELKAGSLSLAESFSQIFGKLYHLQPEPLSKFARAKALRKET